MKIDNDQIGGTAATVGILLNNDTDISVIGNRIFNTPRGITLTTTSDSNVVGNNVHNTTAVAISSGIHVGSSSTANNITNNVLLADSGATATQGLGFDSTVSGNNVGGNAIVGFASPIVDEGTNDTDFAENGIIIGQAGTKYTDRQFVTVTSGCTAAANTACTFTATWPHPFLNTTYAFSCFAAAATGQGLISGQSTTTTTSVITSFFNPLSTSNTLNTAYCEAWE